MPRRKIQRAFLSWLDENHDRFAIKIRLGKRTDRIQEFSFVGINSAIQGVLNTYEISIFAIYGGDWWDILADFDVDPKGAASGGYYCDACSPEARRIFPDRHALWADHLFEKLLKWVNEDLANAKWLALYGSLDDASWARLLPGDDPTQPIPGGGLKLTVSAMVSGLAEQRKKQREPTFLLPCRVN